MALTKASVKTLTIPGGALAGTHTPAASSATVMTDAAATLTPGALVGLTINNTTDASYGVIIANTVTTVTVFALAGGADNKWETGDAYTITINTVGALYLPFGEFEKVTDAVIHFDGKFAAGLELGIVTTMLPLKGTHTAGGSATVMTDAAAAFITNSLKGLVIRNVTDGSSGVITANTATTVTVTALTGGTNNAWALGNAYYIGAAGAAVAVVAETQTIATGNWAASVIADVAGCKFTAIAQGE